MRRCLESLGNPVEVVQVSPIPEGLKVKWRATVLKPFSLVDNGMTRSWQEEDRFELEVRLQQIGDEWKIVGF